MAFEKYCKSSEAFKQEALQIIEELPTDDKEIIKGTLGFETDLDITYLVNNEFCEFGSVLWSMDKCKSSLSTGINSVEEKLEELWQAIR